MAQTGDELGYYYVDDYIETGYYAYEPYIAADYIDATYFQEEGAILQASAALTVGVAVAVSAGIIKSSSATLDGVFTPNILAVASRNGSIDMAVQTAFASEFERTRSSDVTLENLVNLSLQAARIRDNAMAIAAAFAATSTASRTRVTSSSLAVFFEQTATATKIKQFDATLDGVFTPDINATASLNGSIDLHSTATASADAIRIKQFDASLSTQFTSAVEGGFLKETDAEISLSTALAATAIEYQLRDNPYNRPINFNSPPYNFSTTRAEGSHSLQLFAGTDSSNEVTEYTNAFNIDANEDFILEFYFRYSGFADFLTDGFYTLLSNNAGGSTNGWRISIQRYTSGGVSYARTLNFELYDDTNTEVARAYELRTSAYPLNTWILVTAKRTDGIVSIQTNQTYNSRLTDTYNGSTNSSANRFAVLNSITSSDILSPGVSYDRIRIARGTSTWLGASSTNTVAEYLFNNDALDNWNITHSGSATLSSEFSATANTGGTLGGAANLSSTATISADVDKILDASANLATAFTTTVTIDKILDADISLNATFAQTSTVNRIQQGATSLASAFTQNAVVNTIVGATSTQAITTNITALSLRIKPLESNLTAFVSTLVAAAKVGDFFVNADLQASLDANSIITASGASTITSTVTQTAINDRIRFGVSDLSASTTLTVEGELVAGSIANLDTTATLESTAIRIKGLSASLDSAFSATATGSTFKGTTTLLAFVSATLDVAVEVTRTTSAELDTTVDFTADVIKAVEASANLNGVFSPTITVVATKTGEVLLDNTATMQSTVRVIKGLTGEFASTVELAATAGVFKGTTTFEGDVSATLAASATKTTNTSAEINVVATQSADVIKAVETSANLNGVFSPTITVVANKSGDIDLAVETTQSATAVKTVSSTSTQALQATLTATGSLTKQTQISVTNSANLVCAAGVIKQGASNLSAEFTSTAIGTIIDTTRYVYVVPRETRLFSVQRETTTHTVHKETRIYTLGEL